MSHGGEGGSERWLISYADFITLLMVLFVILYSMGQIDVNRYKQLADSLRVAFNGGPARVVDPMIDQAGNQKGKAPAPIIIPGIPSSTVSSEEVAAQLSSLLAGSGIGGSVSVQNNIEGVLISLSEKLLFKPGTSELQPEAYPVLDAIIKMLKPLENDLRVVGHTDSRPPADERYSSNWELSTHRAVVIIEYLVEGGIEPERITASGQGDNQPLFPNDSAMHRRLNNRAEVIVVFPVQTDAIDLEWHGSSSANTTEPSLTNPGD
jgi:chemotaxis protein MotB